MCKLAFQDESRTEVNLTMLRNCSNTQIITMLSQLSAKDVRKVEYQRFKLRYGHLQEGKHEQKQEDRLEKLSIKDIYVKRWNTVERPGTGGRERIFKEDVSDELLCVNVDQSDEQ